MKKKYFKVLQFLIFLAIGVLLLYFAFKDIDFNNLLNAIINANYLWISLALLAAFVALISRSIRWNMLINPLGFNPKVSNSYHALILGYVANMAIPRIGEITRCGVLGKTENIPVEKLIGTVILERFVDFICLMILILVIFFTKIQFYGSFFVSKIFSPLYNSISNNKLLLILFVLFFIIGIVFIIVFKNRLKKHKLLAKIYNFILGLLDGIKTITKLKNFWLFIFHTILIWFMYFLMTYLMFFSIEQTSFLSPADGLFVMIIGGLGMTAPVQGGFGAFHWIVSLGLMLYGISMEDGLIYATISHESQALFMLLLGGISFIILFFNKKVKKVETVK